MDLRSDQREHGDVLRDLQHAVGGVLLIALIVVPGIIFGAPKPERKGTAVSEAARERREERREEREERRAERREEREERREERQAEPTPTTTTSTSATDGSASGGSTIEPAPTTATATTVTSEPTTTATTTTAPTTTTTETSTASTTTIASATTSSTTEPAPTTATTATTAPTTTTTTVTAPTTTTVSSPPTEASLSAEDLTRLAALGYLSVPPGELAGSATRATMVPALTTTLTLPEGLVQVAMPAGTTMTPASGTADFTRLVARDKTHEVTHAAGQMLRAIEYGVPGARLTFDRAVTITIPVGRQYDRQVLEVYRSPTADLRGISSPMATCMVTNGLCMFLTTGASYFVVVSVGSIMTDSTPPAAPSDILLVVASHAVTITWRDPPDRDLARVAVLRNVPPSTAVSGSPITWVPRGTERYVDTSVQPGEAYLYMLRAEDASGNVRNSEALVTVTPSEGPLRTLEAATVRPLERAASIPEPEPDAPTGAPFLRAIYGDFWSGEIDRWIRTMRAAVGGGT